MAKGFYAVLRGRQPGVYDSYWSAQAQVRGFSDAYQRGFTSREDAEDWLLEITGCKYPSYSAFATTTPTHRIASRTDTASRDSIYLLRCDGASRGNPGPAGCGGCIWLPRGTERHFLYRQLEYRHAIGEATNNAAEYRALIKGLTIALALGVRHLWVQMDSELVVKQSSGQWATHHAHLAHYRDQVQALLHQLEWWRLDHIPREDNHIADQLANDAIDRQSENVLDLKTGNTEQRQRWARQLRQQLCIHGARMTLHNSAFYIF